MTGDGRWPGLLSGREVREVRGRMTEGRVAKLEI